MFIPYYKREENMPKSAHRELCFLFILSFTYDYSWTYSCFVVPFSNIFSTSYLPRQSNSYLLTRSPICKNIHHDFVYIFSTKQKYIKKYGVSIFSLSFLSLFFSFFYILKFLYAGLKLVMRLESTQLRHNVHV